MSMKAVILAAGRGTRLAPYTDDRPKPLVPVGGRPLLLRAIEELAAAGVNDVVVVGGYRDDVLRAALEGTGAQVVMNPRYHDWNNFYSLLVAREATAGHDVLEVDGDLLFEAEVVRRVLAAPGPGVMAIDAREELDPETMKVAGEGGVIRAVAKGLDPRASFGEYIGILRLDAPLAARVYDDLARFEAEGLTHEYYEHAIHRLAGRGEGPFHAAVVSGLLAMEIDDHADLARAEAAVRDVVKV